MQLLCSTTLWLLSVIIVSTYTWYSNVSTIFSLWDCGPLLLCAPMVNLLDCHVVEELPIGIALKADMFRSMTASHEMWCRFRLKAGPSSNKYYREYDMLTPLLHANNYGNLRQIAPWPAIHIHTCLICECKCLTLFTDFQIMLIHVRWITFSAFCYCKRCFMVFNMRRSTMDTHWYLKPNA